MCGMFSGYGKTCPTDQDLWIPDADKGLYDLGRSVETHEILGLGGEG